MTIRSRMTKMQPCDVVAILSELPEQHIGRGQVGTVVEELDDGHVLVEFSNSDGATYATVPVPVGQLLKLKHTPICPSA